LLDGITKLATNVTVHNTFNPSCVNTIERTEGSEKPGSIEKLDAVALYPELGTIVITAVGCSPETIAFSGISYTIFVKL
tara:strand:+ start:576 stop:812 length:237 start_codon:yes stop_codon:yes gene_type:complete